MKENIMTSQNYTRTISVNAKPEQVYHALTEGMHEWWTKPDAPMKQIGDRSKFTFPPGRSFWTFEARTLEFATRVEMVCVEAFHLHDGLGEEIETEWLNTKIIWNIEPQNEGTVVKFEHDGLRPSLLCYEVCEAGWDMFFVDSLKAYLDTGIGKPFIDNL